MVSSLLLSLIPLLLLVVFGAWAISTILRAVTLPRSVGPAPTCAACAYEAADLSANRCPECGQDYRLVGIRTRYSACKDRGSYAGLFIAWSLLALFVLLVGSVVITSAASARPFQPTAFTFTGSAVYTPARDVPGGSRPESLPSSQPAAPSYTVSIHATLDVDYAKPTPNPDGETVYLEGGNLRVTIASGDAEPVMHDYPVLPHAPIEPGEIDAHYEQAGLDLTHPAVRAEADQLVAIMGYWRDDPETAETRGLIAPGNEILSSERAVRRPPNLELPDSGSFGSAEDIAYVTDAAGARIGGLEKQSSGLVGALNQGPVPGTVQRPSSLGIVLFVVVLLVWAGGLWLLIARRRSLLRLTPPVGPRSIPAT